LRREYVIPKDYRMLRPYEGPPESHLNPGRITQEEEQKPTVLPGREAEPHCFTGLRGGPPELSFPG